AFAAGDVDGVLAIFGERFTDMSNEQASFYGGEAPLVMRHRVMNVFKQNHARLAVTIIAIRVLGNVAFDWGWHQLTLTPKNGGEPTMKRTRYLEIWQKDAKGQWRIITFLDNPDMVPEMPPRDVLEALKNVVANQRRVGVKLSKSSRDRERARTMAKR